MFYDSLNSSMNPKLKQIAISHSNYDALKKLGEAGDSFNDVVTMILKERQVK
jgi:hypothetical protein